MGHEPREHEVAGVQRLEPFVEVGLDERVRVALDHHRLARAGRDPVDDRAALALDVVQRTGAVVVLDVDDRDSRRAGPLQQRGRLVQRGLHTVEFHHALGVGVLAVDQDQRRSARLTGSSGRPDSERRVGCSVIGSNYRRAVTANTASAYSGRHTIRSGSLESVWL